MEGEMGGREAVRDSGGEGKKTQRCLDAAHSREPHGAGGARECLPCVAHRCRTRHGIALAVRAIMSNVGHGPSTISTTERAFQYAIDKANRLPP